MLLIAYSEDNLMKRCSSCGEWNDDKAIRCWQCRQWFDEITAQKGKTSVETDAEKQSKSDSIQGPTKLSETWTKYKILIVTMIILIVVILFNLVQKPDVNKSAEQGTALVSPNVVAPVVPATPYTPALQSDSTSQSASARSANELFNKALALCPDGKCTDPQQAIEYLDEAIRQKPDLVAAYNNRGNAYNNLGQHQRAIENYNEAIRIKPNNALPYGNRGGAYDDLGQHQRAIEDYNEAIRLNPDYVNAFINRGNVYFSQGNKDLGCSDAQKACELGNCQALETAKKKGYCP
jgi:tetratricopeptide (TPR) repeat protein